MTIRIVHITTLDVSLYALLFNQLQSLRDAGYDVTTISSPGPDARHLQEIGIPHLPIPIHRTISPLADLRSLWKLYRTIRRGRFAIVHTHTPKAGLLGQLAARLAGVPVIVNTVHGFYFHGAMPRSQQRFYITLERIAALCSTLILSQNREDIDTAIQEHIAPREKIQYLGNGIDLTRFDPAAVQPDRREKLRAELGLSDDTPVIGFVGRLAAVRKGVLDLLAAGRLIVGHRPDVRFVFIGETDHGKPDAVTPEVAAEYGIADHCLFLGGRPNADLPLYYSLMDVVVLPSLFEGVPRVIMEASAMGIPCVVTDVKGNREAVLNGQNGLHVPLHHPEALSEAILTILGDPDKAAAMGQRGREIARERFDERLVFETIRFEYEQLLRAKNLK